MIVTELGLTFRRTGDAWQCVEHPTLWMLRSGGYQIVGISATFPDLATAVRALTTDAADSPEQSWDTDSPSTYVKRRPKQRRR